ncbi:MAG: Fur family transcriptional regulator [Bacillota bacterium]
MINHSTIIQQIREKGYKVTPQRRAIIEALFLPGRPPTAKEVLAKVRAQFPDVSLDTVYRNLNLLVDIGLLIQINLKNNETTRFEILEHHHHHLVCLGCGEAICLEHCALNERDMIIAEESGYEITGHAFELYGYCPVCRSAG